MKRNWIPIIIYILFIGAITYLVGTYTEVEKAQDFIASQKDVVAGNDLELLSVVVVANNNNGTEAYIKRGPLFSETYESHNFDVTIYIYSMVQSKGNSASNSLVLLVKDLRLNTDDLAKDDYKDNILKADFIFNQNVTIGSTTKREFTEEFATLYEDKSKAIIINYDKLKGEAPLEIESITIKYVLQNGTEPTLVTLSNTDLITLSTDDKFDGSYDRDIKNVNSNSIDLISEYGVNNLSNNPDIFYDGSFLILLQSKSLPYYAKNIAIEFVFVAILTYFVFFHKHVMKNLKQKKAINKELVKAEIEKIKKIDKE